MFLSPLPPEIRHAIAQTDESARSVYHLADQALFKDVYVQLIADGLSAAQRTLVVTPHWLDDSILSDWLADSHLASYMLPITDHDHIDLVQYVKSPSHPLSPSEKDILQKSWLEINQRVTETLGGLHQPITTNRTFKEIVFHNETYQYHQSSEASLQTLASIPATSDTLQQIDKLQEVYDPRFQFIDYRNYINFDEVSNDLTYGQESIQHTYQQVKEAAHQLAEEIQREATNTKEEESKALPIQLYNLPSQKIEFAVNQAITTLRLVNRCHAVDRQFTTKFLHLSHLQVELQKATQFMSLAALAINDTSYIAYRKLKNQLHLSDAQWDALTCVQAQWTDTLLSIHKTITFNKSITPDTGRLDELYTQYINGTQTQKHLLIREIHNTWSVLQQKALSQSNENYSQLSTSIKWDLYPVQVISEYQLNREQLSFLQAADHVIFFDMCMEEYGWVFDNSDLTVTCLSSTKKNVAEIDQNSAYISSLASTTVLYPDITSLDTSDRYQLSVKLANNLMTCLDSYSVYKVGREVIISSCDPTTESLLEKSLDVDASKILYKNALQVNGLVESFIHYDDITLVIENGLLNDQQPSDLSWQHHVIRQLDSAGVKLANINTYEAYVDLERAMLDLKNDIFNTKIVELPMAEEA